MLRKNRYLPKEEFLEVFMKKNNHWVELEDDDDLYILIHLGEIWDESSLLDINAFKKGL